MKKTFELYSSLGNEPLKKMYNLYATEKSEIIKTVADLLLNLKTKYPEIKSEFIVKQNNKQILHFTA